MHSLDEELRRCRSEIARLYEENSWLRYSSESFSALAERLNNRLIDERRSRATLLHDRPAEKPPPADRPRDV
jgi:hypothetical protein